MEKRIQPVILCGGAGTRLWPLARIDRPKPLVAVCGEKSLLQLTLDRVSDRTRFETPLIVVGGDHAKAIILEMGEDALAEIEPAARGTAAAIALAALRANPTDLLLVLPSDHLIADEEAFQGAVAAGVKAAEKDWLVTFGVKPDRPETGYGYIETGNEFLPGVNKAARFVEKPDRATAEAFVAGGKHFWNAGIFLFRAWALLEEMRAHAPDIVEAVEAELGDKGERKPERGAYARAPVRSIDHAVMERSDKVAVVPVEMGWSDVGSWEAVYEMTEKDAAGNAGNATAGDVVLIDCEDSLVRSEGPLIVAVGIKEMVVVATERSVLIVPKGDSQRVKEAVEELQRRGVDPPKI